MVIMDEQKKQMTRRDLLITSASVVGVGAMATLSSGGSAAADAHLSVKQSKQVSTNDKASTYDSLAREILMLDKKNQSLIPQYMSIIGNGLPRATVVPQRKDVIVLGAGIAGLLTGKLLKDAGYNVTILEANGNRIGGRIKTFRSQAGQPSPFSDPRQYAEAGAMRIPTTHPLVTQLVKKFKLKTQPFYNVDVAKDNTEHVFGTWLSVNGIQVRARDYNAGKLPLNQRSLGFPVSGAYQNLTASKLLDAALNQPSKLTDLRLPIAQQIEGWKKIIANYDDYSMYRYLSDIYSDETVVQYIGTLQNLTSRFFLSFLHSFIDTLYINPTTQYFELVGGNWQLPYAFLPELSDHIVMNARAVEIRWADKAMHRGQPGIYVRTVNEPAKDTSVPADQSRYEREFTADYLVIAIPFSSLRFVNVSPLFSYPKRRAITELHYDAATKVLLEFSERFWEWDETEWQRMLGTEYRGHNSYGGGSITDTPNRFIYYPSHKPAGSRGGGVILASYTWADDANRWDSIPDSDRYRFVLQDLINIYGSAIERFFTGHGQTQSWMEDFYAFGEAAVFTPGQFTELHPAIPTPEGPIHFAGEHTSLKHAWIEGAIESAIRVALEIHQRAAS